jgi:hypothetical protein
MRHHQRRGVVRVDPSRALSPATKSCDASNLGGWPPVTWVHGRWGGMITLSRNSHRYQFNRLTPGIYIRPKLAEQGGFVDVRFVIKPQFGETLVLNVRAGARSPTSGPRL